jgi:hypothetical protein
MCQDFTTPLQNARTYPWVYRHYLIKRYEPLPGARKRGGQDFPGLRALEKCALHSETPLYGGWGSKGFRVNRITSHTFYFCSHGLVSHIFVFCHRVLPDICCFSLMSYLLLNVLKSFGSSWARLFMSDSWEDALLDFAIVQIIGVSVCEKFGHISHVTMECLHVGQFY